MDYDQINAYLVDIFNRVTIIEENSLKVSNFKDVSLKEMHTVDLIGKRKGITPSEIAQEMALTLGTVTTSLNKLEDKGYISRTRSDVDRRIVHTALTSKGRVLYRLHRKFHKNMVLKILEDMNASESLALQKGLERLHYFLEGLM